jgi:hypothetical protein
MSFTVLYQNKGKTLDIIAKTPFDYKLWTTALFAMIKKAKHEGGEAALQAMNELHVEYAVEDRRRRSVSSAAESGGGRPDDGPVESYQDAIARREAERAVEARVTDEYAEVTRRLAKYQARARETEVYVSPQYRAIQSLLDQV